MRERSVRVSLSLSGLSGRQVPEIRILQRAIRNRKAIPAGGRLSSKKGESLPSYTSHGLWNNTRIIGTNRIRHYKRLAKNFWCLCAPTSMIGRAFQNRFDNLKWISGLESHLLVWRSAFFCMSDECIFMFCFYVSFLVS